MSHKTTIQLVDKMGVVVIGRNEGERLNNTLSSVISVGVPLIYVDSRSKDNSVKVAQSLDVEVLELSDDKPVNAARARNEGASALIEKYPQLDYLYFLDGDTTLEIEWLAEAFTYLKQHPGVGFLCGQLREKDYQKNIYRRLCDMEWHWKVTQNAQPCDLGGMGVIPVPVFVSSGGFNENLISGEDPELYTRLVQAGWSLHVISAVMGVHDSGMQSFRQWWVRSVKFGFGIENGQETEAWIRERRSAILWGGFLPFILIVGMVIFNVWVVMLILIYPLNIARIWAGSVKREFSNKDRWLYASSCMVSKIPQFIGILKFHWVRFTRQTDLVIQYK